MTIHWCGTGLSATPGLRRLLSEGLDVTVWNRTPEHARAAVGDLTDRIETFDPALVKNVLEAGDVVVSMLPAEWQAPLADMAANQYAHFVSPGELTAEMRGLDDLAHNAEVAMVNEVGLAPGIDHLLAHRMLADYRASDAFDPANEVSLFSFSGGFPTAPGGDRYKFSWSPLEMLRALQIPAQSLRAFEINQSPRPWQAMSRTSLPLPRPEEFEVYPAGNALPLLEDYRLHPDLRVRDIVRGTLRPLGWAEAWKPVLHEIETLDGPEGEMRLREMAETLGTAHAYAADEADRVVLYLDLSATHDGTVVWHKTCVMDARGDDKGSAMARLVSTHVALAAQAAADGEFTPGVHGAPSDTEMVERFLGEIEPLAQHVSTLDRL
ncbi:saccharopine dehydrogenase (NADP+, L-glutamate forming) [Tranquillimonas rosea]|uniref:Saccharopine dehydrogenase (NADP+, L-glutamate forming) n=1 Tax=Tranquillimonas rosea TaxID=641238 RepID=A0A1H9W7N1_9RHOB|nr:saccharopine dehydrogenase C-terminal domain-containing protein [Tranquillimonas rosea]SES29845.1 saccharopine dehydrogenase (NADP+, L-glutamate forming) [Tranquillimonas rosea]